MIKMVFFDIDGTLLDQRSGRVPARAKRAVQALRARGIAVVLATGRHPIELDGAGLNDMNFDGYAAANGQMCLDAEGRLFAGYPIPNEGVAALARLFERQEMLLWFFGESDSYVNYHNADLAAMAEQVSGLAPVVRGYVGEPVYQAVAFVRAEDEAELAAQLPGCRLQRWGSEGVDIIAADGGKVEGMRHFLTRAGLDAQECMAFGDQHNDIDMLRFAGVGVAMGNATPEVKRAADYVTRAVHDDGVAAALEHFGLLESGWDEGWPTR